MTRQQPAHSLAGFELPIEEFVDWTVDIVNRSNPHSGGSVETSKGTWRRTESLGTGSYGHIWLQERHVDMRAPQVRAVKEVSLYELRKDGIAPLNEVSAMARFSKLKHNNCAVFGEFYGYAMNTKTLFLAMEYHPHRDLKRHIEASTTDEQEAKRIVYDVLVGLRVMHAEGIVHRDLKPENIFVASKPPESPWSLKIADFGISKHIPPEREWSLTPRRGTKYYTAPEADGLTDPCQQNPGAMDMWSLGVMVYYLATKQYPFTPREVVLFCRNDGKFAFPKRPMLERWSKQGLAFVEALLRPMPRDRLCAECALQHPWITSMSEELMSPFSSSTLAISPVNVSSLGVAEGRLVISSQDTTSGEDGSLSVMEPMDSQLAPSVQSVVLWPEPLHVNPYAGQAMSGWPRTPYEHEIPSANFYKFILPDSPSMGSRRRRLDRRASAPTPSCQVEDAMDRISPRTHQIEYDSPLRLEWSHNGEVRDLTSSLGEMSMTESLDSLPPPHSQTLSLAWRRTRLRGLPRSNSDTVIWSSSISDRSHQAWKKTSVLEFVTDPRFTDSVNALYYAIRHGRDDVVDLLLDRGVDIETVFRDPPHLQYGTALHLAVSCGQADIVKLLLRRGASVTAKAKAELYKFHMKWLEPLHLAAYYGLAEIARMLLARGSRLEANAIGNFHNREKRTPLHLAVLGDEADEIPRMVRLLLDYGADPKVKDDMGMSPGDYAAMLGQENLRRHLPASPSSKLKAKVVKMRIKFGPFAVAAPLILGAAGAAGVAMALK